MCGLGLLHLLYRALFGLILVLCGLWLTKPRALAACNASGKHDQPINIRRRCYSALWVGPVPGQEWRRGGGGGRGADQKPVRHAITVTPGCVCRLVVVVADLWSTGCVDWVTGNLLKLGGKRVFMFIRDH